MPGLEFISNFESLRKTIHYSSITFSPLFFFIPFIILLFTAPLEAQFIPETQASPIYYNPTTAIISETATGTLPPDPRTNSPQYSDEWVDFTLTFYLRDCTMCSSVVAFILHTNMFPTELANDVAVSGSMAHLIPNYVSMRYVSELSRRTYNLADQPNVFLTEQDINFKYPTHSTHFESESAVFNTLATNPYICPSSTILPYTCAFQNTVTNQGLITLKFTAALKIKKSSLLTYYINKIINNPAYQPFSAFDVTGLDPEQEQYFKDIVPLTLSVNVTNIVYLNSPLMHYQIFTKILVVNTRSLYFTPQNEFKLSLMNLAIYNTSLPVISKMNSSQSPDESLILDAKQPDNRSNTGDLSKISFSTLQSTSQYPTGSTRIAFQISSPSAIGSFQQKHLMASLPAIPSLPTIPPRAESSLDFSTVSSILSSIRPSLALTPTKLTLEAHSPVFYFSFTSTPPRVALLSISFLTDYLTFLRNRYTTASPSATPPGATVSSNVLPYTPSFSARTNELINNNICSYNNQQYLITSISPTSFSIVNIYNIILQSLYYINDFNIYHHFYQTYPNSQKNRDFIGYLDELQREVYFAVQYSKNINIHLGYNDELSDKELFDQLLLNITKADSLDSPGSYNDMSFLSYLSLLPTRIGSVDNNKNLQKSFSLSCNDVFLSTKQQNMADFYTANDDYQNFQHMLTIHYSYSPNTTQETDMKLASTLVSIPLLSKFDGASMFYSNVLDGTTGLIMEDKLDNISQLNRYNISTPKQEIPIISLQSESPFLRKGNKNNNLEALYLQTPTIPPTVKGLSCEHKYRDVLTCIYQYSFPGAYDFYPNFKKNTVKSNALNDVQSMPPSLGPQFFTQNTSNLSVTKYDTDLLQFSILSEDLKALGYIFKTGPFTTADPLSANFTRPFTHMSDRTIKSSSYYSSISHHSTIQCVPYYNPYCKYATLSPFIAPSGLSNTLDLETGYTVPFHFVSGHMTSFIPVNYTSLFTASLFNPGNTQVVSAVPPQIKITLNFLLSKKFIQFAPNYPRNYATQSTTKENSINSITVQCDHLHLTGSYQFNQVLYSAFLENYFTITGIDPATLPTSIISQLKDNMLTSTFYTSSIPFTTFTSVDIHPSSYPPPARLAPPGKPSIDGHAFSIEILTLQYFFLDYNALLSNYSLTDIQKDEISAPLLVSSLNIFHLTAYQSYLYTNQLGSSNYKQPTSEQLSHKNIYSADWPLYQDLKLFRFKWSQTRNSRNDGTIMTWNNPFFTTEKTPIITKTEKVTLTVQNSQYFWSFRDMWVDSINNEVLYRQKTPVDPQDCRLLPSLFLSDYWSFQVTLMILPSAQVSPRLFSSIELIIKWDEAVSKNTENTVKSHFDSEFTIVCKTLILTKSSTMEVFDGRSMQEYIEGNYNIAHMINNNNNLLFSKETQQYNQILQVVPDNIIEDHSIISQSTPITLSPSSLTAIGNSFPYTGIFYASSINPMFVPTIFQDYYRNYPISLQGDLSTILVVTLFVMAGTTILLIACIFFARHNVSTHYQHWYYRVFIPEWIYYQTIMAQKKDMYIVSSLQHSKGRPDSNISFPSFVTFVAGKRGFMSKKELKNGLITPTEPQMTNESLNINNNFDSQLSPPNDSSHHSIPPQQFSNPQQLRENNSNLAEVELSALPIPRQRQQSTEVPMSPQEYSSVLNFDLGISFQSAQAHSIDLSTQEQFKLAHNEQRGAGGAPIDGEFSDRAIENELFSENHLSFDNYSGLSGPVVQLSGQSFVLIDNHNTSGPRYDGDRTINTSHLCKKHYFLYQFTTNNPGFSTFDHQTMVGHHRLESGGYNDRFLGSFEEHPNLSELNPNMNTNSHNQHHLMIENTVEEEIIINPPTYNYHSYTQHNNSSIIHKEQQNFIHQHKLNDMKNKSVFLCSSNFYPAKRQQSSFSHGGFAGCPQELSQNDDDFIILPSNNMLIPLNNSEGTVYSPVSPELFNMQLAPTTHLDHNAIIAANRADCDWGHKPFHEAKEANPQPHIPLLGSNHSLVTQHIQRISAQMIEDAEIMGLDPGSPISPPVLRDAESDHCVYQGYERSNETLHGRSSSNNKAFQTFSKLPELILLQPLSVNPHNDADSQTPQDANNNAAFASYSNSQCNGNDSGFYNSSHIPLIIGTHFPPNSLETHDFGSTSFKFLNNDVCTNFSMMNDFSFPQLVTKITENNLPNPPSLLSFRNLQSTAGSENCSGATNDSPRFIHSNNGVNQSNNIIAINQCRQQKNINIPNFPENSGSCHTFHAELSPWQSFRNFQANGGDDYSLQLPISEYPHAENISLQGNQSTLVASASSFVSPRVLKEQEQHAHYQGCLDLSHDNINNQE